MRTIKRMFWDIETSPNIGYFWRTGYRLTLTPENIIQERKIICICWKWEGEKQIHSLTWKQPFDDRAMIKAFLVVAEEADEMVAHNGDQFDWRWFKGQIAEYGLGAIPEIKTVDTYAIAKKNFYYNSHRLDYLAQKWFGNKKIHVPYSLWARCCEGDQKALREMVRYCKHDVKLQEMIWTRLSPYYRPKTHAGVLLDRDRWTCPRDGSHNVKSSKIRTTAAGMLRHQFRCLDCGQYYTVPNNIYLKYMKHVENEKAEKGE